MARSTADDKGTKPLLAQRFGGDAPAATFFLARAQALRRTADLLA
jgi:hypothetical protein